MFQPLLLIGGVAGAHPCDGGRLPSMSNLNRHLLVFVLLCTFCCVRVQLAVAQEDESNVIPPITEQASNVTFYGNGAVILGPFLAPGAMPQATPNPECQNHRQSQIAFRVTCTSDPKQKSTESCSGSISLFALGITQNVSGEISGVPGGSYTMTLHSPDMSISSCTLSNSGRPAPDTGNTILMQSCAISALGCRWNGTGASGNRALTTSASVSVQPIL